MKPVLIWLSEALTRFVNGSLDGLGAGGVVGGGVTGFLSVPQAATPSLSPQDKLLLGIAAAVLSAGSHGFKEFLVWHKTHPVPNPFLPSPPAVPAAMTPASGDNGFEKLPDAPT